MRKTRGITKIFNSPQKGCYALALSIFLLGLLREQLFVAAMTEQGPYHYMDNYLFKGLAVLLGAFGGAMVGGAYVRLGVTGTYLGDYFGILMKERVTGFPFNVLDNPMYMGSTILFLAHALWLASPVGLLLTMLQYIVYIVAISYEGPFTDKIYSQRKTN